MEPLERFGQIVRSPSPALDEALAVIAAVDRREVEPAELLLRLDGLAERVVEAGADTGPAALCAALFGPGGFQGDRRSYYDRRNSLLDQVLERRRGIPITLSVVAISIGARVGVDLVGIGAPGHYLVRDAHDDEAFFDPFHGGAALDSAGCGALLSRLAGRRVVLDRSMLQPAPPGVTVGRVVANLRNAALRSGDRRGLVSALRMTCRLPGAGPRRTAELAAALGADGRFDDAAELLERLAVEDPSDAERHRAAALALRARMN